MKRLLLIVLALSGCSRPDDPNKIPTAIPGKSSQVMKEEWYIAAGQSNMLGFGMRSSPWNPSQHVQVVGGNMTGPAVALGLLRSNLDPSLNIHIIQCSVNGSFIESWEPNASNFNVCLDTWRSLGSPPIKAVLWMQGEAEGLAGVDAIAALWGSQFDTVLQGFRQTLNNPLVVFAQLGPNPGTDAWRIVQEQQAQISLPNVFMVRSLDLSRSDDNHLDKQSYEVLGQRMNQYL